VFYDFNAHIVLAYEAKPKSEAELRHILPPFRPLRGAKTAEKIAEQQSEHWTNWEQGAASRVHCADVSQAVAIVYKPTSTPSAPQMFDRKLFHIKTEKELYEALVYASDMSPYPSARGNCRWLGENTQLAVKTWQFQLAKACYFSGITMLPNWLVYGAKHFSLSSLLEAGDMDTDVAVEMLLPADKITELRAIEDPLERQALTTEACFIQVGELPAPPPPRPSRTTKTRTRVK